MFTYLRMLAPFDLKVFH